MGLKEALERFAETPHVKDLQETAAKGGRVIDEIRAIHTGTLKLVRQALALGSRGEKLVDEFFPNSKPAPQNQTQSVK